MGGCSVLGGIYPFPNLAVGRGRSPPMFNTPSAMDTNALQQRFAAGDRRALSRILTLVQAGTWNHSPPPSAGSPAIVVGITGSGGAGKSTLVGALLTHLRRQGKKVAVLAFDPQSPRSGGSLLGDRIRVTMDPEDNNVYFRSFSTRGATGGVGACAAAAVGWAKAFGFDVILVETVGVGQDQFEVRDAVDTLVLVVTPMSGDEIQWEKAGLIELADLVVVNKADQPGADRVAEQLMQALNLSEDRPPIPILATSAISAAGVPELWDSIVAHGSAAKGQNSSA